MAGAVDDPYALAIYTIKFKNACIKKCPVIFSNCIVFFIFCIQAMDLLAEGAADAPELPPEMKTAEMRVTFKKLGQMLRKMERL
jgi:hypothetical protein